MIKHCFIGFFLFSVFAGQGQVFTLPLVASEYKSFSSNTELMQFLDSLDKASAIIEQDTAGFSFEGKPIPLVKLSADTFTTDKPAALLFAQQHGDEPSGKEGMLMLVEDFAFENLEYLLEEINVLIMPQTNPDGGDIHKRKTAEDIDMNRDHLLMESQAIEDVFEKYHPELTVEIHEYETYGDSWQEFGYRRDFDIQVGTLTNPNE